MLFNLIEYDCRAIRQWSDKAVFGHRCSLFRFNCSVCRLSVICFIVACTRGSWLLVHFCQITAHPGAGTRSLWYLCVSTTHRSGRTPHSFQIVTNKYHTRIICMRIHNKDTICVSQKKAGWTARECNQLAIGENQKWTEQTGQWAVSVHPMRANMEWYGYCYCYVMITFSLSLSLLHLPYILWIHIYISVFFLRQHLLVAARQLTNLLKGSYKGNGSDSSVRDFLAFYYSFLTMKMHPSICCRILIPIGGCISFPFAISAEFFYLWCAMLGPSIISIGIYGCVATCVPNTSCIGMYSMTISWCSVLFEWTRARACFVVADRLHWDDGWRMQDSHEWIDVD